MPTLAELLTAGWQSYDRGNLPQADSLARQVLAADPASAGAVCLLGTVCQARGQLAEATAHFLHALRLQPTYAEAHNNLGVVFAQQGQLQQAVASFRQAVQCKPGYPEGLNNLGNALRLAGRAEEAIAELREAVRLQPNYVQAHTNLGLAALQTGDAMQAVQSFEAVRPARPDDPELLNNLGYALRNCSRSEEALRCFDQVLATRPDHAAAHHNRAVLRLLLGDYAQGWAEYEWRWRCPEFTGPPFRKPLWDGTPLAGRRILLHTEQGMGDTFQFVRYAPLVKERGGTVYLACPRALVPILSSCPGIDQVIAKGTALPDFEVHAPLLTLPWLFETTLQTVPAQVPYLAADPALVERWRSALGQEPGFKVGIFWQGSPKYREDRARSIPLACFEPLARLDGVRLFSLQKGLGVEQIGACGFPVVDLGSRLDETTGAFMDTAAVLRNLHLVVTCDSAVEHLAGALGVPVWIALPFVPDYRWMLGRDDSPWYPTVRLFRQTELGAWGPVFGRMAGELGKLMLEGKRSEPEA
jgi:Flp pilus assembly protein TadD